jgi:hypothetical protein
MARGRFYLRCESAEWDFIRSLDAPLPFDAAIVSDRYLAAYPEGHARYGEERDQLIQALDAQGVPWSVDPDTARLEQAKSAQRQSPRAAARPLARAVALPLTADRLADREQIDALVEAAAVHQLASAAFAAPYLEIDGVDDPRFAVNLRLLRGSRELAGDRALIAYLQVLASRMLDGSASEAARRLAGAGAEVIVVRVRRFEAEQASEAAVVAYAGILMGGERAGARMVGDCVGRLGPVLVAAGADGFATNARYFRKLPDDLHPAGSGGGAGELVWELPTGATMAGHDGSAVRCAVPDCPAPTPDADNAAIRVHNLHQFHLAARQAAAEGLAYAQRLAGHASPVVRGWARALQSLERRAA